MNHGLPGKLSDSGRRCMHGLLLNVSTKLCPPPPPKRETEDANKEKKEEEKDEVNGLDAKLCRLAGEVYVCVCCCASLHCVVYRFSLFLFDNR